MRDERTPKDIGGEATSVSDHWVFTLQEVRLFAQKDHTTAMDSPWVKKRNRKENAKNRITDETIWGVANGTSKNVVLGKFWQDLEISEAFLISLEVSFMHGLFLLFMSLETFYQRVSGSDFLTRISASRRVSDFTIRHPSSALGLPNTGNCPKRVPDTSYFLRALTRPLSRLDHDGGHYFFG